MKMCSMKTIKKHDHWAIGNSLSRVFAVASVIMVTVLGSAWISAAERNVTVDDEGTIHTPNGILPISPLISVEAHAAVREQLLKQEEARALSRQSARAKCDFKDPEDWSNPAAIVRLRQCVLQGYDFAKIIAKLKKLYPVSVKTTKINGIEVDIMTPKNGISDRNRERVLLHIHGSGGYLDHPDMRKYAIPVASLGNIKVLGVDHRLMPEGTYEDTLKDVSAVYKAMLDDYPAENIGIFGCSQGAYITAQMVPWLHKGGLPGPGAISINGDPATLQRGDSTYTVLAYQGNPVDKPFGSNGALVVKSEVPLYGITDPNDPVLQPLLYPDVAALFPPTILMNSMRDASVSNAAADHRALLRQGVEAELHIWEGLPHCFQHGMPEIPESREYFLQMLTFFDKHLGTAPLIKPEIN